MRTAIVTENEGRKDTGDSVIFLNGKEAAHILSALELAKAKHPRRKLFAKLVAEFEMVPCAKIAF